MKKIALLFMALALSCSCVKSADWQSVDTSSANLSLSVDIDSVKNINPDEYVYAIKYRVAAKPEQVAYIKSNFGDNYIGVIKSGMFDENEYRPQAVFANPRVFMKPVVQDSFLNIAHRYVFDYTQGAQNAGISDVKKQSDKEFETVQTVEPASEASVQKPILRGEEIQPAITSDLAVKNMKEYVAFTGEKLVNNWEPPKSGRNTQAIVILEIGADGSLQNYKFAKSSGDKLTDRSIMSAIELSAPFARIPGMKSNVKSTDMQFVFEYKYFRKSVI